MTKACLQRSHLVLQEGEPEIGLVRTISATARQELRNLEGLSDQMREKLDQLDEGTYVQTPNVAVVNSHRCSSLWMPAGSMQRGLRQEGTGQSWKDGYARTKRGKSSGRSAHRETRYGSSVAKMMAWRRFLPQRISRNCSKRTLQPRKRPLRRRLRS